MNFNISGIRDSLLIGYQYIQVKAGVLGQHSVTILKQGLEYTRQNATAAGICFFIANPIFLEISIRFTKLVALSDDKFWKNILNLTLVFSLVGGMNIALAQGLQSSLTSKQIALIANVSCISYIFFRLWIQSLKGEG